MVFYGPQRVETQRLDELPDAELLLVNLGIGDELRDALGRSTGFCGFESIPIDVVLCE